jgi:hypothetical protein
MATKTNPGAFDCYANAAPDEPLFVLLGRDKHAPLLVRLWARLRALEGEDLGKVREALECADAMEVFRENSGRATGPVDETLARLVAGEITRQHGEDNTDNLGDGESLLLLGFSPAINVVELVERLTGKIQRGVGLA